ncbi:replication initiator protein A [Salinicoccus kekensis]|uniref:Replication initiator protein A n=1 Tax=Salinicoccus kekensis TaxID=714307 RepID=A0A285UTE1_9STAP|nr:replication initiator protein A [Salinicoccus kekensis]SOC45079.1 replication initiator protein A [Salinicoccus kekensis]
MESQRISAQKYNQETFYKLYKFLFKDDRLKQMSDSAKIAYTLFRDRFYLSQQNNWIDKNGHIYLHFTIAEICDVLGCANQKATKLKRELKQFGLLEEERVGFNKPNKIYMLEPKLTEETSEITDMTRTNDNHDTEARESNFRNHDNHTSRNVTITHQEMWKSLSNKNYSIKTNNNKTYYNLNNMYNLEENDNSEKQTSHSSNANHRSQNKVNQSSEEQHKKNFSFNKYPEKLQMELKQLNYQDAKLLMDISNKAKSAVSREYADMKKRLDFTYEFHEFEISQILNRMIQKAKYENVSIAHMSRYISRSIQNYFRKYAEESMQEIIEQDMYEVSLGKHKKVQEWINRIQNH